MRLKIRLNYSQNFTPKKRIKKTIKFIIIHYTGMKKESSAIKKLVSSNSKVSSHYFIKDSGEILAMVPDLYAAWHAGESKWKNFISLNNYSIGIEINNPGHDYGYRNFSSKQINSLLSLIKHLIKKFNINHKNILGHSDIAPDRKKDPGEKFPWEYLSKKKICQWHTLKKQELIKNRKIKISKIDEISFYNNLFKIGYSKKIPKNLDKDKYLRYVAKAFQRRFRQDLINSKIDRECLLISKNLINRYK